MEKKLNYEKYMQAAKKIWDDWSGANKKKSDQQKDNSQAEASNVKPFFVRKSQGDFFKENQNSSTNARNSAERPKSAFQILKKTSNLNTVVNNSMNNRVIHS